MTLEFEKGVMPYRCPSCGDVLLVCNVCDIIDIANDNMCENVCVICGILNINVCKNVKKDSALT